MERKTNDMIARFNDEFVCNALAECQTMNKSDLWKIKKRYSATDLPYSFIDSFGNEITDPQNICDEYRSEFKNRI